MLGDQDLGLEGGRRDGAPGSPSRPRSRTARLGLWAGLTLLAALPLAARRSWSAWEADVDHLDPQRREMTLLALRGVPPERVQRTMSVIANARRGSDPATMQLKRDSLRALAPRAPRPSVRALAWIEEDSVAAVLEAIDLSDEGIVQEAIRCLLEAPGSVARKRGLILLAKLGPRAAPAIPAVRRLMSDPDPEVRRESLRLLSRLDPGGPYLFRAALVASNDPDSGVRRRAWRILVVAPQTLDRARDPRLAPILAEGFAREFPALPVGLREALAEGLAAAR